MPKPPTPICPSCKSKFSHNSALLHCNVCGLPDEIRDLGPQIIARWKRKVGLKKAGRKGSRNKKILAHGRQPGRRS